MKKILYFLIAISGSCVIYRAANVYWMLAFLGLGLAIGITLLKLHLGDALRLWGIVLGILVIMLGGAVILARGWSEFAAGVWILICIVLLFLFQHKIKRMIPIFYISDMFEKIINEKSERKTIAPANESTDKGSENAK